MTGVTYGLVNFITGGPIIDLPVMKGARWAAQLNRSDALSCKVSLKDPDNLALDLRSATEPDKTILLARTDQDNIIAWGTIDGRDWDDDSGVLSLAATGVLGGYFGKTLLGPPEILTAPLITLDAEGYRVVNPALDTNLLGLSLGTIGKRLVAQRLAFPGAPTYFDLPADEVGTHERNYAFSDLKMVGDALADLANVEGGPDFAFDAQRSSDGLTIRATMRHGSQARPRIGAPAGVWSLGPGSPITNLKISDSSADLATAAWELAGRSSGQVLMSRRTNPTLVTNSQYPPTDIVDTSHGDVKRQTTLDAYAAELIDFAKRPTRDVSFSVRADAAPALGAYRPGDTIAIDVPESHPYLTSGFTIRVTSISGDERAKSIKIGAVIVDA